MVGPEGLAVHLVDEVGNKIDASNPLDATLAVAGDIQIGAVELKNGSSDQRATVDASGQLAVLAQPNVVGFLAQVEAEFARPGDTNAYAALDVVSNSTSAPTVLTFNAATRVAAGSGYITKARIMTDLKTATNRFRLHLFIEAPTAINDNTPYLLLYANRTKRIGRIDFPALATEDPTNSTAAAAQVADVRLPFAITSGDDIFGVLETLDAIAAPGNAQAFYVQLAIDQN